VQDLKGLKDVKAQATKSTSKYTPEGAKIIAAMKKAADESVRLANLDLKRGYESLQTPFPDREYLSTDPH